MIAVLAVLRHLTYPHLFRKPGWGDTRVLHALSSLFLGQVGALAIGQSLSKFCSARQSLKWFLVGTFFLMILISTGQRTAIAAGLVSVGVILVFAPYKYRIVTRVAIIFGFVSLASLAVIAFTSIERDELLSYMPSSVQEQLGAKTTFEWRKEQTAAGMRLFWDSALLDQTVGAPIGRPILLRLLGVFGGLQMDNFTIHSHYVNTLVKRGALGLGVFLLIALVGLYRIAQLARQKREINFVSYPVLLGLLLGQLVFSYAYWLMTIQGLILGLFVAHYRRRDHGG